MITSGIRTLTCTSLLALMTVPWAASAQSTAGPADAADEKAQSNDIIVTANKRRERIQDVALSVTAVTGDSLNQNQLLDIQDLATRVPGLNFQRGGNGPQQRLIIRGLNAGGGGATVASVVDDVPLSISSSNSNGASFAADFDPYDIERIEVLRGPQGSLYGASAQGGLIKYVTKAPDPDALRGGFDVGTMVLAHGKAGASGKAYLNVPIAADVAAIRVSGYYEYGPGWIDNALGGYKDANAFRRYGGRVSLLVRPVEKLTVRATAFVQDLQTDGYDTVEVRGYTDPANRFALLNGYNKDTFLPEPSRNRSEVYSANLDYAPDGVNIQSITSYGKLNTSYQFDTPLYAQAFGGLIFGRPKTALVSGSVSNLKKFSQEIRLSSDNDVGKTGHGLEWQIGGFYTHETSQFKNDYITRDYPSGTVVTTPASPTTSQVFLAALDSKYREIAGYADATYHFSPRFDIEAGGRLFNNKQNFSQSTGGIFFLPATFTTTPTTGSSETSYTFSVAPRFHFTPDAMIYARAASGYRPGGPNVLIPPPTTPTEPATPPTSFESDSTVNYEVGLKTSLFRNMLSVDVAAYYIDWTNIQVSVGIQRASTGYTATVNAGQAVSKGFEWNIGLTPVRGLRLGWLGAYTDASLTRDVPQINGKKGVQLSYVPKWSTTATVDYEWPVFDDYKAYVGTSFSYVGKRFTSLNVNPVFGSQEIPSYDAWSLQAGLRTGRFGIQLYGKNLGDTRGITSYSPGQLQFGVSIPGAIGLIRPREVGMRLTSNF